MNLVKELASEVVTHHWWTAHTKVVVAVSTGVDSMVLLTLMERLRYCRPRIIVAHVNHELRRASRTEEHYLRRYCAAHQLKLVVAHWPKSQHPHRGIENAARLFRYRFFAKVMRRNRASVLLTAHHLNDQAETILMRLIRGGDLNELTGIHQVRSFAGGKLIRPLLCVPKAGLYRYAKVHRVKYFVDQTNYSLKMTRNRMRNLLLPMMQRENPRALSHLGGYAIQLQRVIQDNQLLNHRLAQALQVGDSVWWQVAKLCRHSVEVQDGILRELFRSYNPQLLITPPKLAEIVQLLNDRQKPQGRINLNQRLDLVKNYRKFRVAILRRRGSTSQPFRLRLGHWYRLPDQEIMVVPHRLSSAKAWWYLAAGELPLSVRAGRSSDLLRLKNGGHQKVRRVLINQKVPNQRRRNARVLVTCSGRVLALLGYKSAVLPLNRRETCYSLMIRKGN